MNNWIAELDGKIVSAWSTIPVQLLIQGRIQEAYWIQASAVSPNAQGLGLGRKVFRAIVSNNFLTLGVGITTPARKLYMSEKVRFVPAECFATLSSLSAKQIIRFAASIYRLRFYDAWEMALSATLRLKLYFHRRPANLNIIPIKEFSGDYDGFIVTASRAIPVMSRRTLSKLPSLLGAGLQRLMGATGIRSSLLNYLFVLNRVSLGIGFFPPVLIVICLAGFIWQAGTAEPSPGSLKTERFRTLLFITGIVLWMSWILKSPITDQLCGASLVDELVWSVKSVRLIVVRNRTVYM